MWHFLHYLKRVRFRNNPGVTSSRSGEHVNGVSWIHPYQLPAMVILPCSSLMIAPLLHLYYHLKRNRQGWFSGNRWLVFATPAFQHGTHFLLLRCHTINGKSRHGSRFNLCTNRPRILELSSIKWLIPRAFHTPYNPYYLWKKDCFISPAPWEQTVH